MRKVLVTILMLFLFILTGCTNYEEVYIEGLTAVENQDFRDIDAVLDQLENNEVALYNQLMDKIYEAIDEEVTSYTNEENYVEAIEYLENVVDDVTHIPITMYDTLISELENLENGRLLLLENENKLTSVYASLDKGNIYDAMIALESLDITEVNGVAKDTYYNELLSLLLADIFTYFWDVETISDFKYIEEELRYAVSMLSEREQFLYARDLMDLQWHHQNYDLVRTYLDDFIQDYLPEYYDEFVEDNEYMEFMSYEPTATEMAEYLEPKSAIVNVYSGGYLHSTGSGFFVNDNGLLVTNHHVIDGGDSYYIETGDGNTYSAYVMIYDAIRDVAIMKVDVRDNDYVYLGSSYYVQSGDEIFTYGSPLGVTNTITEGIISKNMSIVNGQEFLQLSAPISPGSSGGMLVNAIGDVIGITSAYLIEGQNMNLAIPINRVINLIHEVDSNVQIYDGGNTHIRDITLNTIHQIERYLYIDEAYEFFGYLDSEGERVYGILNNTDGTYYEGELAHLSYEGIGYYADDYGYYFGEFHNGQKNGDGTSYWDDGDFYIGEWKDDDMHGKGQYYWGESSDTQFGHVYLGDYYYGVKDGSGTYIWPDGAIYDGEWNNDDITGYGTYYFDDGSQYIGDFIDGYRTGYGYMYDGYGWLVYEGYWLNDWWDGYGTNYDSSGIINQGYFAEGIPTSMTKYWPNGDYYVADWTDWGDATGIYYWANGDSAYSVMVNFEWIN